MEESTRRTLRQRFERSYIVDPSNHCWIWKPLWHQRERYGAILLEDGTVTKAHRASWILHRGPIPEGLHVCHHCDTQACVNPHHLFVGTAKQNHEDSCAKGRRNAPKGEAAPQAKLTEQAVREIRQSTEPQRTLGERYGVSGVAIHLVRQYRTWKHVE